MQGGVGKSTLARIIAVEAIKGGLHAKIADLDTQQTTSVNWAARRAANGLEPPIRAETFRSVDTALQGAENFDLYIFDGTLWHSGYSLAGRPARVFGKRDGLATRGRHRHCDTS